ncbi:MAG TPA: alpha-glucuronidase family glycosyl hydrolase [Gemmatimonadaceae bacterium]
MRRTVVSSGAALSRCRRSIAALLLLATPALGQRGTPPSEDGYDLWLRYRQVADASRLAEYRAAITALYVDGDSPTLRAAHDELIAGLIGLLGRQIRIDGTAGGDGLVVAGTPSGSAIVRSLALDAALEPLGDEGYLLRAMTVRGKRALVIAANSDVGVLYGAFALLSRLQQSLPIARLDVASAPRIQLRLIDHWDNLDRSIEHGYGGLSLWEWSALPDSVSPRYRDYARAEASIGVNGVALTNVNANAKALTAEYVKKVAALATVFRPYGIRVYLTARFSAPIEIGGLKTADPLDSAVRAWWKAKADEIYAAVPEFGGFLVKANSEGQPGPQDYKRSHADGANMLADAVGPHGGIVIWRAFVYSNDVPIDRVKQAYSEFTPLDGEFRDNVLIQVKNGPLDFQPREPFSPLFGAMPRTPLILEFQITKEYLGEDAHLVFLGSLFSEVLTADTWVHGKGSTIASVIDGSLHGYKRTGMAGVANTGTDRNWTGSHFNQANWYAFGRLAWDPLLSPDAIAEEWTRRTFSNDPTVVAPIVHMMLVSREAIVNYMEPLGLAHMMGSTHHYGPAPWARLARADWTPSYYHRADTIGVGFERSPNEWGSDAVSQYAQPLRDLFGDRAQTPDSLLLWFHHVGWTERTKSGRTLWEDLFYHYREGIDTVRSMRRTWQSVKGKVDSARFHDVDDFLAIQEHEAVWWRDAVLSYFQTFSNLPVPNGYAPFAHPLSFYRALPCPIGIPVDPRAVVFTALDRRKPRCPQVY